MQHFTYKYWSTTQTKGGGDFEIWGERQHKNRNPKSLIFFFSPNGGGSRQPPTVWFFSSPSPKERELPAPPRIIFLFSLNRTTEPLHPHSRPPHSRSPSFPKEGEPATPLFLAKHSPEPFPFDFLLPQPPDASLPSTLSIVFSSKNRDWLLPPRPLISFSP